MLSGRGNTIAATAAILALSGSLAVLSAANALMILRSPSQWSSHLSNHNNNNNDDHYYCSDNHNNNNAITRIQKSLERLYPSTALDQRIALSRRDGYWPYIQKGEDPPPALVYGEFDVQFFAQVLEHTARHYYNYNKEKKIGTQDETTTTTSSSSSTVAAATTTASEIWNDKVFCDLGSGTGRLVLAAAALYPWKVCRGIELLEGIHQEAVEIARTCCCGPPDRESSVHDSNNAAFATSNAALLTDDDDEATTTTTTTTTTKSISPQTVTLAPIELRCGSFDDPYEFYGDADLIFVFSTCMDTPVLINLARSIGRQCQSGCLVLTTEYKLPLGGTLEPLEDDPDYPSGVYALELVESITGANPATGGESTVHIHRVTKALGNGLPRQRPQLSVSDICYRAIQSAEDPSVNNPHDFVRRVSNQMAFVGLPESWRPKHRE